jgi:hypothetical protein
MQYSGWFVSVGINSTGFGWRESNHQTRAKVRNKRKEARGRRRRMRGKDEG